MCASLTLPLLFSGLGAAASVFSALGSKPSGGNAAIASPTAPPASQAAKTPEANVFKAARGGAMGTGDPTLLSGAGGVDNSSLTLGKSTLLGS